MIIGSGLLARSFSCAYALRDDICLYAAGVSNSTCVDHREFLRERKRLEEALQKTAHLDGFVYFGTCSIADPDARKTPYVQHKLEMEKIVSRHPRYLILRLPQVAGKTPNPHTLLNFLYARIARSESFNLWRTAKRNIIDISDASSIAEHLISDISARNTIINIANQVNYSIVEIVRELARITGKKAVYKSVDRGSSYLIDISDISNIIDNAGFNFGKDYLTNVLEKYYK
ncbi:MAG: NAD-dependent dehydratase [Desulfobacterales bacterium]|nr:NAD-dependent dehydratase [Desulfobacterales bacterium]